jgi:HPt (histidine-containing phosphotransfer) domain-containing protein
MSDGPSLDPNALASLHHLGGEGLVRRMIDLFLENACKRIEAALEGEKSGDMHAIERAAHSLKSSAGNVGATGLQQLACRLERSAGEKQWQTIPTLLRQLEKTFGQVKAGLKEARERLGT